MRINENTDLAVVIEVMECAGTLRNKSFSITGHLGRKRDDIVAIIKNAGGTYDPRPRYGTTFLICNFDWNANSTVDKKASSKLLEAKKNHVRVISEATFYEMIMSADAANRELNRE